MGVGWGIGEGGTRVVEASQVIVRLEKNLNTMLESLVSILQKWRARGKRRKVGVWTELCHFHPHSCNSYVEALTLSVTLCGNRSFREVKLNEVIRGPNTIGLVSLQDGEETLELSPSAM